MTQKENEQSLSFELHTALYRVEKNLVALAGLQGDISELTRSPMKRFSPIGQQLTFDFIRLLAVIYEQVELISQLLEESESDGCHQLLALRTLNPKQTIEEILDKIEIDNAEWAKKQSNRERDLHN